MDDKTLIITTEDGKEIKCTILFTYHSDEYNKDYVVFVDENNVASAAIYNSNGDGKGELLEIKSEGEWNMLEKLLNEYNEDNDDSFNDESCSPDQCEGCASRRNCSKTFDEDEE